MNPLRIFLLVPLLVAGCVADGWNDEVGSISQFGIKGSTGTNGDSHYCIDPAFPCLNGEGDCDTNGQCDVGLTCGVNNGPQFGFSGVTDVCVAPHCTNGVQDADETAPDCGGADCGPSCAGICDDIPAAPSRNHCSDICQCTAGDADCDRDSECVTGLVCGLDLGDQFGFATFIDVCVEPHCANGVLDGDETTVDCGGADCGTNCGLDCSGQPANGLPGHCSTTCVCPQNHGHCLDSDANCAPGLACIEDVGPDFGFTAGTDVCLPANCENGVQDGDEEGIDCGGSCGFCAGAVTSLGGAGQDRLYDLAVDSAGNYVVIGRYNGTLNLGGADLNSVGGSQDIFVAKFNAAGTHIWSHSFGGSTNDGDHALAVAIGPSDQVAITGNFGGTVDFGAGPVTTAATDGIFVALLESNGTTRWANGYGTSGVNAGRGVTVRANGDVVAVGSFEGTTSVGGTAFTSAGDRDIFVGVYASATGIHQRSSTFGGTGRDTATDVVGSGSNVYISGDFSDAVTFGGTTLTSNGQQDAFSMRLSVSTLNVVWAAGFGGTGRDSASSLSLDPSNRVILAGYYKVTVDFGGGDETAVGSTDVFLLGLGTTGGFRWVETFGGTGADLPYAMASNPDATEFTMVGMVDGDVANFPGGAVTSFGSRDLFVVSYDTAGTLNSSFHQGGAGRDEAFGVGATASTRIVGGQYAGTATINGEPITSAGGTDSFVTSY